MESYLADKSKIISPNYHGFFFFAFKFNIFQNAFCVISVYRHPKSWDGLYDKWKKKSLWQTICKCACFIFYISINSPEPFPSEIYIVYVPAVLYGLHRSPTGDWLAHYRIYAVANNWAPSRNNTRREKFRVLSSYINSTISFCIYWRQLLAKLPTLVIWFFRGTY